MVDMKYTSYSRLKGADFSEDPSRIDRSRSPDILNMISDEGGNPVKRKGWKIIKKASEEDNVLSYHKLYSIGGQCKAEYRYSNYTKIEGYNAVFNGSKKVSFSGSLYCYDKVDGCFAKLSSNEESYNTYTPKTLIATDPVTGAGTVFEGVNLLSGRRVISYMWGGQHGMRGTDVGEDIIEDFPALLDNIVVYNEGDTYRALAAGEAKGKRLEAGDLLVCTFTNTDSTQASDSHWMKVSPVIKIVVPPDKTISSVTVRTLKHGGTWSNYTYGTLSEKKTFKGLTFYTYRLADASSIGYDGLSYPLVADTDNIEIECVYSGTFGFSAGFTAACSWNDRVFLGGEINGEKNKVYYTEVGDPSYIPDTNYIVVDGDIKDLVPCGDSLAIIKGDDDKPVDFITETSVTDTSVDINGNATSAERYVYRVTHGSGGFKALSSDTCAVLAGEPMFLSNNGIVGVVSGSQTNYRYIKNRSRFVDKKLLREPLSALKSACAIVFKGYYILSVGDHCYILDSRQKATDVRGNTTYLYEAYYWDNIKATSFVVADDENGEDTLYFIRDDGEDTMICRFADTYSDGYYDSDTDKVAINAHFATLFDNDGTSAFLKTLQKKGTGCSVVPHVRSSVTVYFNKDDTEDILIGTRDVSEINYENLEFYRFPSDTEVDTYFIDVFGFTDIDFTRIAFISAELTRDFFFRKKMKKYKRLQIKLENKEIDEPFGILEIFKTYQIGNYAKR